MALWLLKENQELKLQRQADTEEKEKAKLLFFDQLKDQYSRLKKKFFGFGRERLKDQPRPIGHLQPKLNVHSHRKDSEAEVGPKSQDNENSTDLRVVKNHDFSKEVLEEESKIREIRTANEAWVKMDGLTEDSIEITVTERVYTQVVHKRAKYRLKDEYNDTEKEVIITAPGPAKLNRGCKYSIDFAVAVVSDKYEYHLPLERQRRKMESAGLNVDVKTLYGLCSQVSTHCESVLPLIREDIMGEYCALHLDESPWRIQGADSNGYMWVMSNRMGVYYQFEPTRSGKVQEELLKGYEGAIVVDAYSGYNSSRKNPKIRVGHCWSHARREFFERWDDYPAESGTVIEFIDKLFDIESEAKNFEQLAGLRRLQSRPIIEALEAFMREIRGQFLRGEGISKAIDYCLRHWTELTLFLDDITVPISNNDAERALRHIVMGRKNFNGSKTINGADTAATLYTVIESCKKHRVQPTEYLKYIVEEKWHKREPLPPSSFAWEIKKFPKSKMVEPKTWKTSQIGNNST